MVAASIVAGLVAALTVAPASSAPPGEVTQILVRAGDPVLDTPGVEVERDIGFGWVLATASETARKGWRHDTASGGYATPTGRSVWPNSSYDLTSDPLFSDQWHLDNIGQGGGTPGADIDVLDAWDWTVGSPSEVIAVIDSGIDLDHPELIGRLWVNDDEIPDNGMDDDGNGYVDDRNGWDMVERDPLPQDAVGHGTAVAGTAVAALDGAGIVGAAPGAVVMPIRACPDIGCPWDLIAESIGYAIANGATIINLSLGGDGIAPLLAEAIDATTSAGILVVAAAGNSGVDIDQVPFYPAALPAENLIAVAATDRTDQLATFASGGSNYGMIGVDLAAPGKEILTTVIDGYASASGTSFAAPLVAATAALVRTVQPSVSSADLIDFLMATTDPLDSLDGLVASGGRLDAGRAVTSAATNTPPIAVASATPDLGWAPLSVTVDGSGSSDAEGPVVSWTWQAPAVSPDGEQTQTTIDEIGVHEVTLTVTDIFGSKGADTVQVLVGADFVDTRSSIFRLDIAWMSALGITRGCNPPVNDRYCPDDSLTRSQLAAFLTRALDLPPTTEDFFTDDDGSIFEDDINRLAADGITRGCNPPVNDRYCPDDSLTRSQLAAFLRRFGNR
jgi:subtilisin family serine protease